MCCVTDRRCRTGAALRGLVYTILNLNCHLCTCVVVYGRFRTNSVALGFAESAKFFESFIFVDFFLAFTTSTKYQSACADYHYRSIKRRPDVCRGSLALSSEGAMRPGRKLQRDCACAR